MVAVIAAMVVLVPAGLVTHHYLGKHDDCAEYAFQLGDIQAPYVTSDGLGDVFILDSGAADGRSPRVLKLAPGTTTPIQLAFPPLTHPSAITADVGGAVAVYDYPRAIRLLAATGDITTFEFPTASVKSIALRANEVRALASADDGGGHFEDYVYSRTVDGESGPRLAPGQTWLESDIATDADGAVLVSDSNVVVKAGRGEPRVVPIAGVTEPSSLTVDAAGVIYVVDRQSDGARVLATVDGRTMSLDIPNGFSFASGIAVDNQRNVFVADYSHNRVLKLPASRWTQ